MGAPYRASKGCEFIWQDLHEGLWQHKATSREPQGEAWKSVTFDEKCRQSGSAHPNSSAAGGPSQPQPASGCCFPGWSLVEHSSAIFLSSQLRLMVDFVCVLQHPVFHTTPVGRIMARKSHCRIAEYWKGQYAVGREKQQRGACNIGKGIPGGSTDWKQSSDMILWGKCWCCKGNASGAREVPA